MRLKLPKNRIELLREFAAAPNSALFSQDALCAVLDWTGAKAERARWAGGGPPYIKLGHQIRYQKGDILAWLDKHRVDNTAQPLPVYHLE